MNLNTEKLYSELRNIRKELTASLEQKGGNPQIKSLIEDELRDVNSTLMKIKNEDFGVCEVSGELLPEDALRTIPTLRSKEDVIIINSFYFKPLH